MNPIRHKISSSFSSTDHSFHFFLKWIILLNLFTSTLCCASSAPSPERWLRTESAFALQKIIDNISPPDSVPGVVVAAKSKYSPNYYYHWVRDAGIVFDALANIYQHSNNTAQRQLLRKKFNEYLDFSTHIQNINTLADLGEPKFNIDGSAFNEPWGRPQNDGPALRALSLIHWSQIILSREGKEFILDRIYDKQLPAKLPLKKDLEYVSHHWKDATFDLWEEVKGSHFYTLMVSRRALLEGGQLAKQLGDSGASEWYILQAKEIELELQKFWDANQSHLIETINVEGGVDYKNSNLDTAVVLGLLHGDMQDGFLPWDDERVLKTIDKLIQTFSTLYPINHHADIPGYAIGRYPEDRYDGIHFALGNPWPLCTLAIAEALYRYAAVLENKGKPHQAQQIIQQADQFVARVQFHAYADGSLSEQINRDTGFMMSAQDLTWNYVALLTAANRRAAFFEHRK